MFHAAGAGSLAEIVCCRVPSVMVPYPYAADDHQRLNARFLESKGGGVVCEDDVIENELIGEVREMMFNEELRSMIGKIFLLLIRAMASKMVEDIRQVLSNEKGRETKASVLEGICMIDSRKIFLFGAGGMGMSPLACYLRCGFEVEHMTIFSPNPLIPISSKVE